MDPLLLGYSDTHAFLEQPTRIYSWPQGVISEGLILNKVREGLFVRLLAGY